MERKIDLIFERLASIDSKLERIESDIKSLKNSCEGMDSHINFVESVYGTVRYPLDFITEKVAALAGTSHRSLPPSAEKNLIE